MSRNSEYLLPDGSPRYGIRVEEPESPATPLMGQPASLVQEALRLDLTQLRAALDLRYSQPWADKPDERIKAWQDEHPREANEAAALTMIALGPTPSRWLDLALANEG